jgi:hypothetical protein
MPNWCQNVATITHEDKEKIDNIENELNKDKDDSGLFQMLRPRPKEFDEGESWYGWNIENWGTKWEASVYDFERIDDNSIKINFDTAWGPCIALYEYLDSEGYEIEAFYNEEGMAFCGKFSDGWNDDYNYSDMDSAQMQEDIPSEIDDMFGLSERKQDEEMYEDEDDDTQTYTDDEDDIQTYDVTDWFDKKVKPVRVGLYEVKTESWPFPQKVEWTGRKWATPNKISEWRGITEEQHNSLVALEKLKEEFDKLLAEEIE